MAERRKFKALPPEGGQSLQFDERRELNATSRGAPDPVRSQRRIVSDSHRHRNVYHRAGGSGIEAQPDDGAATRPFDLGPDDDETAPRIE